MKMIIEEIYVRWYKIEDNNIIYYKQTKSMNRGLDNNLWTPEVTQHGGHMIMENVKKPSKIKYLNIDSRFQEEYNLNKGASFTFQLPQKMTDIKSIAVRSAEIPMTFYYFSAKRGNTSFLVKLNNTDPNYYFPKTIPDGNYTVSQLQSQITNALFDIPSNPSDFQVSNTNKTTISNTNTAQNSYNYNIYWDTDICGNFQRNQFKTSLGWCLGFRQTEYVINSLNAITSEAVVDVYNIRYLFLVVDEFRSSNPNSFISPLASSLVSKNILARITLNPAFFPYGTILPANTFNGYLLSDQRVYSGKTDIQKLQISLVDEYGNVVDLNGVDFSFCLEIEHE